MVVNSINFWLFFAAVLIPYFTLLRKNWRGQNLWLLLASYFFYGWADWKMIPLLLIVTIVFYYLGLIIKSNNQENPKKASRLTTLGVVLGIVVLFYFKYLGFFVQEFASLFESFGLKTNLSTFNIIMPIGISFFTFKLMSYVIEVHRENIDPTKDIVQFGTYIAFFPTILSGPIDRPVGFIPQLNNVREFDLKNVSEGLKLVLWGMFLKMCIADQLSGYTDAVLNNYTHHNTTTLLMAIFLYSFQMYTDFCGYSDMAIGVSRMMGIRVRVNFARPFFAKDVAEYWRRWHMSLTTWLTDYVFMPLNVAFRTIGIWGLYLATVINLIVVGFWHGANWTYGLFGLYHGILLVLVTATDKKRKKFEKRHNLKKSTWWNGSRQLLTFILCTIGFLLFRSPTCSDFFATCMALGHGWGAPFVEGANLFSFGLLSIIILIFKEYKDEKSLNISFLHSKNKLVCLISCVLLFTYILLTGELSGGSFIYFQF